MTKSMETDCVYRSPSVIPAISYEIFDPKQTRSKWPNRLDINDFMVLVVAR